MGLVRCPTCGRSFDPEQSRAMPFCSDRCRLVDLGRWLGEEFSVPVPRWDDSEESPEGAESPPD